MSARAWELPSGRRLLVPFRRDADALGGCLDQLGHMLVIVLANDTTASQTLCLGDIALRLEQTIRRDLFRRSVTHNPPPMLHLHSSYDRHTPSSNSSLDYRRTMPALSKMDLQRAAAWVNLPK